MSIYLGTFLFMFFSGLLVFPLNRVNIIKISILCCCFMYWVIFFISEYSLWIYFLMIFLTMSVCKGALGLSLLVLMVRVHGNDFVLSFNSLW